MQKLITAIFVSLLFAQCTEVNVIEQPAGAPVLEYVDIQPKNVTEFVDSILITIRYSDPDGDLGYEDPDIKPLTIQDLRLQKADSQHVGLLAPLDHHLNITGELTVKLKNTFLLGTSDNEVTSYELTISDRAGNRSNRIVTDQISITR